MLQGMLQAALHGELQAGARSDPDSPAVTSGGNVGGAA